MIVPNYVTSQPNCLNSSHFYAICCRNECEDLMTQIETEVGGPQADPGQVAQIVARLPSDTVQAPRELSEALVTRLSLVATSNDGVVPLHGRLFAQWMHNAFPRECPYPHERSTRSPITPDEWLLQEGYASRASEEEMANVMAADTCSNDRSVECGEVGVLPWSDAEELLDVSVRNRSSDAKTYLYVVGEAVAALASAVLGLHLVRFALTCRRQRFAQKKGLLPGSAV